MAGTKDDPIKRYKDGDSRKVTGLHVTRSGQTFTAHWSLPTFHGSHTRFEYLYLQYSVDGYTSPWISVGGKTKEYSFPINFAGYYPSTGTGLWKISVEVQGWEYDWSETKKKDGKYYKYYYTAMGTSVYREYRVATPGAPGAQITPGDSSTSITYASQNGDAGNMSSIFRDVMYYTGWDRGVGESTAAWAGPYYSAEPSLTFGIAHGAGNITRGDSWTQSFYVLSRYTSGASAPTIVRYVYAWPLEANGLRVINNSYRAVNGRTTFNLAWNVVQNHVHPCESNCVQYCIGKPGTGMSVPSSPSWQGSTFYSNSIGATRTVDIPSVVGQEQAVWARVIQKHGSFSNNVFETPSAPLFIAFGGVKAPQASTIDVNSYNSNTKALSISVANPSELTGAYVQLDIMSRTGENTWKTLRTVNVPSTGTWEGTLDLGTADIEIGARTVWGNYKSSTVYYGGSTHSNPYSPTESATDITVFEPKNVSVTARPEDCALQINWQNVLTGNFQTRVTVATSPTAWDIEPSSFVIDQTTTVASKAKSITVTGSGIDYDTTYYVRLQGVLGQLNSRFTDIVSCVIRSADAPTPKSLALNETADHKIKVSWDWSDFGNASKIHIEYSNKGSDEDFDDAKTKDISRRAGATTDSVTLSVDRGEVWHIRACFVTNNGAYTGFETRNIELKVVPVAPTGLVLIREPQITDEEGKSTLRLSWVNEWEDADSYEISYSQNPNAWDTADGPTKVSVEKSREETLLISNLDLGTTWYAKVRLSYNGKFFTDYKDVESASLDTRTTPNTPTVTLTENEINQYGKTDVSWTYVNEDTSEQTGALILIKDSSNVEIGRMTATTDKAITIYAESFGLTGGLTGEAKYFITVQTTSAKGITSAESEGVTLLVNNKPIASIESTSLVEKERYDEISYPDEQANPSELGWYELVEEEYVLSEDVEVDAEKTYYLKSTYNALTEMPLSVSVTGSDNEAEVTLMVERTKDVFLERPDGGVSHGYAGELIAIVEGGYDIDIAQDSLRQAFEYGSEYRLSAFASNRFGSSDIVTIDFTCEWSERAVIPDGTYDTDANSMIAKITPILPQDAPEGCTCDIYRLSTDKPELIVKDAVWGTTYVDPYPAFGDHGAHRVVLMTANGDYLTEDGQLSWIDLSASVYGDSQEDPPATLESEDTVIDFDNNKINLHYNLDVSHSWEKDFKETKYLGGSVQGDWNPAVTRKGSASSIMLDEYDDDTITKLRQLAVYAGACHIRTPDGSSFTADAQVSENRPHDTAGVRTEYSLSITRVDSQKLDGVKLSDWRG